MKNKYIRDISYRGIFALIDAIRRMESMASKKDRIAVMDQLREEYPYFASIPTFCICEKLEPILNKSKNCISSGYYIPYCNYHRKLADGVEKGICYTLRPPCVDILYRLTLQNMIGTKFGIWLSKII
jgi:hypothetical protein